MRPFQYKLKDSLAGIESGVVGPRLRGRTGGQSGVLLPVLQLQVPAMVAAPAKCVKNATTSPVGAVASVGSCEKIGQIVSSGLYGP